MLCLDSLNFYKPPTRFAESKWALQTPDFRKESRRLSVEVQRVRFDHGKTYRRLVKVKRVCFDLRKACINLVEVLRVCLTTAKRVGGL